MQAADCHPVLADISSHAGKGSRRQPASCLSMPGISSKGEIVAYDVMHAAKLM